jgi:GNAT superfamily N-acetyltransferase
MEVRAATAADVEVLRGVYRRASLSNDGDRAALLGAPDALVWSGDGIDDGRTTVALDRSGRVLGFATVLPIDGGLELDDLFVDPADMRRGVATLLVDTLVRRAARDGIAWIEVTANPHAAAFYASALFEAVGAVETRFGPAPRLRRLVEQG